MVSTETGTTSVNNTYHYDASLQPNAPRQIGDIYYTYDAAGNPTSILNSEGKGKDLRWDAENRLRSISDSQEGLHHAYAYDHTGERILKRYGSAQQASYNGKDVGTLFDFGESYSAYVSPYFVETNNGYTKHYYAGATRLVSKIGEVAQYAAYTPYGELFREYRNVTPYKFNGKELDAETGLYYYGARYYNPSTALWLGVDPLASKYPSVSPYVYCVSNPVKYIDPDGKEWCKNLAGWGENRNVRNAIKKLESGEKTGTLVTWRDNRGYDWAAISNVSTTVNDIGSYEVVVDVDFYVPLKSHQHGAIWNAIEEFESELWIANGHSHGGGTTWVDYTTPEDINSTLGVIGAVTSVMSLGISSTIGACIISGLGLLNWNVYNTTFIKWNLYIQLKFVFLLNNV